LSSKLRKPHSSYGGREPEPYRVAGGAAVVLIEAHRTCGAEVLQVNTGGCQCCIGTANVVLSKYHSYRGWFFKCLLLRNGDELYECWSLLLLKRSSS